MKKKILFIFFIFGTTLVFGQKNTQTEIVIDSIYQELLTKNPHSAEYTVLLWETVEKYQTIDLLVVLRQYEKSNKEANRSLSLGVWNYIYRTTDDFNLKQQLLEKITSFCTLEDYHKSLSKGLKSIPQIYFTSKAKQNIKKALQKYPYDSELFFLCAALDIDGTEIFLREYLSKITLHHRTCWGCTDWKIRLALARLGDKESIDFYIEQFKAYDAQQPGFSKISEKIGYIRQPETIELLKELLVSDKSLKPQYFQNGHGVAFYALHQLTQCIEDFPVTYGERGPFYTLEELEIARTWAKNNTPYKIKK